VQYRQPAIAPLGESRSDEWIAFALAERLGLGEHFWHGDADAAYRQMLAPSGVSLEALRAAPQGIRVPLKTRSGRHRADGGFATPSRRIEIWSEQFQQHGQAPLPHYEEPAMSHARRPELRARYPLVLTCGKSHAFCHSQHRNLPSLRRLQPDPRVEMHPDAAAARGLADGDWAVLETPAGQARARVKLRADLASDVVAAQHGWWQGCSAMALPERAISGAASSNYNLLIGNEDQDPISGSVAHRSYLCQVRAAG
jgi:anaerobic selenocysteine-containing dehydrogenase